MAGWIKMKLGMEVGLGPDHIVRWGRGSPPQIGHSPPNFWPMSVVAKRLDGSRCQPRLDCVRWGTQLSLPQRGTASAMSIVAKLGTVVDLVPGHIVLHGDPLPPRKRHSSPLFSWPNGRPPQLLLSTCLYLLQFTMTPALQ